MNHYTLVLALLYTTPIVGLVLENPVEIQSVPTIERTSVGIFSDGESIYQLSDRKSYFVATPFRSAGTSREAMFGELTDSKRVEIGAEGEKERPWRGGAVVGEVILLLDGVGLEVVGYSKKNQSFLSRHSIIWDNLRPPRDRGGEAATPETVKFRNKFAKAMAKADHSKFVGMTPIPEKWRESNELEFFIATRISGFPLLTMSCTKDDPTRCRIRRGCFVENLKLLSSDDVAGVGIIERKRLVLIGDRKLHGAHILKYNSCFDVRKTDEIKFPKRVFEITNMNIDLDERMWTTSIRPDDYFNSTTFYWNIGSML